MSYDIHITRKAEADINEAADTIEFTLFNPTAADDLIDEAERKINALSPFPEMHPVVDDPVLKSWGIRFTVVDHYLAFYVISESDHIIHIVRFLYQRRDWIAILRKGISLE